MAHTRKTYLEHLEHVRQQLTDVMTYSQRDATGEPLAMAETFEICQLGLNLVPQAARERSILRHLFRTGAWLHLIVRNGQPFAFAQSAAVGLVRNRWSVHNVFYSPLAIKIARATARIDRDRTSDSIEAVLVMAPAYKLAFFLLAQDQDEEFLTVSSPSWGAELPEDEFFEKDEFLNRLVRLAPSQGLLKGLPG